MDQHSVSQSLLNVILVCAESALTLVLRFDAKLRQAAYPLAKNSTLVCIRTYLPHTQIYATFTNKGVLLDSELPVDRLEPDVVINAYSSQLINALVSNNTKQVEKLAMRGASETVTQVQEFLMRLGVASLMQGILKNVKNKKSDKKENTEKESFEEAKDKYKSRIHEQQNQINALTIKNRQLEVSYKELQSKQKMTLITLVIAVIVAIISFLV